MAAVDKAFCEQLAMRIELLVKHMDENVIIEGLSAEDRKKSRKKLKKIIKRLKEGDYKGIIDVQKYHEARERGELL